MTRGFTVGYLRGLKTEVRRYEWKKLKKRSLSGGRENTFYRGGAGIKGSLDITESPTREFPEEWDSKKHGGSPGNGRANRED